MTLRSLVFVALALVPIAAPASAHHSFAIFDQSKVNYLTGTVKQFELVNPHAWLHLVVANDKVKRRPGRLKADRRRNWRHWDGHSEPSNPETKCKSVSGQ